MLNVRIVCRLMNVFVVLGCNIELLRLINVDFNFLFQREYLIFLTLPFLIHVPPIISFRFLFLLKAVIGCSWNNSRRFLTVWGILQFLQTTAVSFHKNRLHVNINGIRFGSCCSWSFSYNRSSLASLSTFPYYSSTSF